MSALGVALALVLPLSIFASSAQGFQRETTDDPDCTERIGVNCPHLGIPLFWEGSSMPIPYLVNADGSGNSFADVAGAVEASFDGWQRAASGEIRFQLSGSTSETVSGQDEQNTVTWTDLEDDVLGQVSIFFQSSSGRIFEADIELNDDFPWAVLPAGEVDPSDPRADIQATVTHEAGHFLGLDHENTKGTDVVMFFGGDTGDTTQRTLAGDDIEGVRAIYRGSGGGGGGCAIRSGSQREAAWPAALVIGLFGLRNIRLVANRRKKGPVRAPTDLC